MNFWKSRFLSLIWLSALAGSIKDDHLIIHFFLLFWTWTLVYLFKPQSWHETTNDLEFMLSRVHLLGARIAGTLWLVLCVAVDQTPSFLCALPTELHTSLAPWPPFLNISEAVGNMSVPVMSKQNGLELDRDSDWDTATSVLRNALQDQECCTLISRQLIPIALHIPGELSTFHPDRDCPEDLWEPAGYYHSVQGSIRQPQQKLWIGRALLKGALLSPYPVVVYSSKRVSVETESEPKTRPL